MLYAWPFDSTDQMSDDDLYLTDKSGFAVNDDPNYHEVVKRFEELKFKQKVHQEWPVGFWLVHFITNEAARKVPYGETDAQTLRNTAIRKAILNTGSIATLLPPPDLGGGHSQEIHP